MTKVKISRGKFERLNACANEQGVITAAAMDHRNNLRRAIGAAREGDGQATADDLRTFKSATARILSRHASAILIDPEYGLDAIAQRAEDSGVILAYERTGYDTSVRGRLPDLLPEWSVRRLAEQGAAGIKILLYYNPFDEEATNRIKHAFIERVGAECEAQQVPFYLEPLAYDDTIGDPKGADFARVKPKYVTASMAEFSKPRYGVDILKVEIPVNMHYVSGTRAYTGEEAIYTREEALDHFRRAADVAERPFIYLSAGVSDEVFREALVLAAEAGVPYSGVLCGRATWKGGIPVYASEGAGALERWLADQGVRNIQALNETIAQGARPWWTIYGGKENIEVV